MDSHPNRNRTRSRSFDSPSLLSGSLRMTVARVEHPDCVRGGGGSHFGKG